MISQIKQKGFTIVELLIVIVVIAILAAISIAAYTNITARANTSQAVAAARSVRDVASAFSSTNSSWPTTKAQFVSGGTDSASKLPADITFVGSLTNGTLPSTGPKSIVVTPRIQGGRVRGFEVRHYDYTTNTVVVTSVGETTGAGYTSGAVIPN